MAAAKVRFWASGGAPYPPYFILRIINSDSRGLPWRVAAVRLCAGHPSSALPDTDGRHDRSGHGTWVLLAVFVAHDCRPWLSVAGTAMQVSACTEEWIRELVTGGRRSARYGFLGSLLSARDWRHRIFSP